MLTFKARVTDKLTNENQLDDVCVRAWIGHSPCSSFLFFVLFLSRSLFTLTHLFISYMNKHMKTRKHIITLSSSQFVFFCFSLCLHDFSPLKWTCDFFSESKNSIQFRILFDILFHISFEHYLTTFMGLKVCILWLYL